MKTNRNAVLEPAEPVAASPEDSAAPKADLTLPFVPAKPKAKTAWQENRPLILIGAGIVVVLLLLAINGAKHRPDLRAASSPLKRPPQGREAAPPAISESALPILENGRSPAPERDTTRVEPEQIGRTAVRQPKPGPGKTLGEIRPFESNQWQPAPYERPAVPAKALSSATVTSDSAQSAKAPATLDKASLIFVKPPAADPAPKSAVPEEPFSPAMTLPAGTRLLARLEYAINSAVRTPVVASIEQNYQQQGEVVVPAGARVLGRVESADRSGYIEVHFDTLLLPDGTTNSMDAMATDLRLRPLRGRAEGKHAGKNIAVRSLAGIGEIATALVGRNGLNQPLSASDLLRERVGNNIGQASDETVGRLSLTDRVSISLPAGTRMYVVMSKPSPAPSDRSPRNATAAARSELNLEELRQLLQLERELRSPRTKDETEAR
jgi:type IV secretory pathway VirB10-like protein